MPSNIRDQDGNEVRVSRLNESTQPDEIADLALWLDASQLDLDDDDPVATWPDLSGNGYDATQATSAN